MRSLFPGEKRGKVTARQATCEFQGVLQKVTATNISAA
jgi:hypothetical protein